MNRYGIVVTRPADAGRALAADLAARGGAVVCAPAFAIGPAPDVGATRRLLARVADFDLAVFVSPAAVRAVAAHLAGAWPAQTAVAAVGAATLDAVAASIPGAQAARLIAPPPAPPGSEEAANDTGSEALWRALQDASLQPRRVLLLRAQAGREWLRERLAAAGAEVVAHAVYTRIAAFPDPVALAAMRAWHAAGRSAAIVITSSEAVDVVAKQWPAHAEVAAAGIVPWLRAATVVVTHERIGERARAAGFRDVRRGGDGSAQAIVAALDD